MEGVPGLDGLQMPDISDSSSISASKAEFSLEYF